MRQPTFYDRDEKEKDPLNLVSWDQQKHKKHDPCSGAKLKNEDQTNKKVFMGRWSVKILF